MKENQCDTGSATVWTAGVGSSTPTAIVAQRKSVDSSPPRRSFGRGSARPSREDVEKAQPLGEGDEAAEKARAEIRESRRRKTIELMSQTGLNLRDLIIDKNNNSSPVEAMRTIMTRGKEKGWTVSKLFGVFLEAGSTDEKIGWERFQSGLHILGLDISEADERAIFQSFDIDNSGTIELSEFTHWCLDIPAVAWRAERVRRTVNGDVDEAAAAMADEAVQAQLPPEPAVERSPLQYPLGRLIYEGSKLFWRSGESLRIAMHENKELNCVTISTMLEGASSPFSELRVDARLIPVNCKDNILTKAVELTESEARACAVTQELGAEARTKLFDKARASVLSEYLLARLKLNEGPQEAGAQSVEEEDKARVVAAAAHAAARIGGVGPGEPTGGAGDDAALAKRAENEDSTASSSSVIKSGSIFPSVRPTPVLVRLPGDDDVSRAREKGGQSETGGGSMATLLLKDPPTFSKRHRFSKRVTRGDFEQAVQQVSVDLAEGKTIVETAQKAQRETRNSLANHDVAVRNAALEVAKATNRVFSSSSSNPELSGKRLSGSRPLREGKGATVSGSAEGNVAATSRASGSASSSMILPPAENAAKRSSGTTQGFAASTRSSAVRQAATHTVPRRSSSSYKSKNISGTRGSASSVTARMSATSPGNASDHGTKFKSKTTSSQETGERSSAKSKPNNISGSSPATGGGATTLNHTTRKSRNSGGASLRGGAVVDKADSDNAGAVPGTRVSKQRVSAAG